MREDGAGTPDVYNEILAQIADGRMAPGAWLREAAISESLGTSRTPVREALRALAADGLVEVVRNRGARVRSWTDEQIAEMYLLRALLEGHGARLASLNAAPEDIERLRRVQEELEATLRDRPEGYLDRVADLNAEFHGLVLAMANSPLLSGFVETLSSVSLVRRAFRGYSENDLARTVISHGDILLGIETGAPDLAQAAMHSHILAATRSAATGLTQRRPAE